MSLLVAPREVLLLADCCLQFEDCSLDLRQRRVTPPSAQVVGLGPVGYFYSATNLFDFVIVGVGAIEFPEVLALAMCYGSQDDPSTCQDSGTALTVLRWVLGPEPLGLQCVTCTSER